VSARDPLVWLAFHSDFSGMAVFHNELDALRYALEHGMKVLPLDHGDEFGPCH
jgi:hypothetical protein